MQKQSVFFSEQKLTSLVASCKMSTTYLAQILTHCFKLVQTNYSIVVQFHSQYCNKPKSLRQKEHAHFLHPPDLVVAVPISSIHNRCLILRQIPQGIIEEGLNRSEGDRNGNLRSFNGVVRTHSSALYSTLRMRPDAGDVN